MELIDPLYLTKLNFTVSSFGMRMCQAKRMSPLLALFLDHALYSYIGPFSARVAPRWMVPPAKRRFRKLIVLCALSVTFRRWCA